MTREVINDPEFELDEINWRTLKDILMNVKRLLIKNMIRSATFKKAVCHFRVVSAHQKCLSLHSPETTSEMQLGDLLEDFVFCVVNHEKLSKKIDYFQISEDEPGDPPHSSEESDDMIQLNTPTRQQTAFEGSKYDMCTVVEESNEEDGDDSSNRKERRKASSNKKPEKPTKPAESELTSFHLSSAPEDPEEDFRTPSSRKIDESEKRAPHLTLSSVVQHFQIHHKGPKKTQSPQQLQSTQHESKSLDKNPKLSALKAEKQAESSADKILTKKRNSKVKMIEKLEKNIFKLFADTKNECFRPKSSKNSSKSELLAERTIRFSDNSLESIKKKKLLGLGTHRFDGKSVSKSVESDRDFSKLSSKDNSMERPYGRGEKRNPLRKKINDQHVQIRGHIEKHGQATERFSQNHIEKDKISVSFNLDLSRILTRKFVSPTEEPAKDFEAPRDTSRHSHAKPLPASRPPHKVPQNSNKKQNPPCQQSERQASVNASERSVSREDSSKSQKTPKKHAFINSKPLGEFLKRILHPSPTDGNNTDRSTNADLARKQRASLGNVHFSVRHDRGPGAKLDSCTPKYDSALPKLVKSSKQDTLKLLHRSSDQEATKLSLIQKKLQHSVLKK